MNETFTYNVLNNETWKYIFYKKKQFHKKFTICVTKMQGSFNMEYIIFLSIWNSYIGIACLAGIMD